MKTNSRTTQQWYLTFNFREISTKVYKAKENFQAAKSEKDKNALFEFENQGTQTQVVVEL